MLPWQQVAQLLPAGQGQHVLPLEQKASSGVSVPKVLQDSIVKLTLTIVWTPAVNTTKFVLT